MQQWFSHSCEAFALKKKRFCHWLGTFFPYFFSTNRIKRQRKNSASHLDKGNQWVYKHRYEWRTVWTISPTALIPILPVGWLLYQSGGLSVEASITANIPPVHCRAAAGNNGLR